jgi:hypothetical protein
MQSADVVSIVFCTLIFAFFVWFIVYAVRDARAESARDRRILSFSKRVRKEFGLGKDWVGTWQSDSEDEWGDEKFVFQFRNWKERKRRQFVLDHSREGAVRIREVGDSGRNIFAEHFSIAF